MTDTSPSFIMFFSTEDDRHELAELLEKTYPKKYDEVDSCGTRVAYKMDNFPDFVQDVKTCAKKLKFQVKRLMAIPDPGLALCMDFPEDGIDDALDSLGRIQSWDETPHHLRPSSYVNYA